MYIYRGKCALIPSLLGGKGYRILAVSSGEKYEREREKRKKC
jgi:hypothetical protein